MLEKGLLEKELLNAIVDICDIQEDIPENLSFETPLIGPDSILGLDSLDAVEIVVMIQDKYGIRLQGQDQGRQILSSLRSLANFIRSKKMPSI
jgi:acyl carrier protein